MKTPRLLRARAAGRALAVLAVFTLLALAPPAGADHHVRPPEPSEEVAGSGGGGSPFTVPDPGGQLWRDVRGAVAGTSQVRGMDAGVLIDARGEEWKNLREDQIYRYAAAFLGIMLGLITLYHLLHGSVRLEHGRSGRTIKRWAGWERALHWYVASLFVVLALTGIILLFGKLLLIPLLGRETFGVLAYAAKNIHNYVGPAFVLGVVIMIIVWIRYNVPKWVDVLWIVKGGGLFGSGHPSAGRMNGGEKGWFWFIATIGMLGCVSGLVLDFPDVARSRADLQLANVIHIAATIAWFGGLFGHAYIGTIGSEGSVEGMLSGKVDVNWAKQHHDLWYAEQTAGADGGDPRDAVSEVQRQVG